MKFIRRDSNRYSKIGKNRKKLQRWRRPKGRDNKIREKRKGYSKSPSVGYISPKNESGKIGGKNICLVYNLNDLEKANRNSVIVIGKVGAKKKLELIGKASNLGFDLVNVGGNKNAVK